MTNLNNIISCIRRLRNLKRAGKNLLCLDSSETQSRLFGVSLGSLVRNQDKENFPEPSVEPPSPDNPNPSEQDPTPTKETDNFIDRKDTKTMADAEKEHIEKLKSYLTNDHPETLGKAVFISSSIGNIAAPQSFAVRKVGNIIKLASLSIQRPPPEIFKFSFKCLLTMSNCNKNSLVS